MQGWGFRNETDSNTHRHISKLNSVKQLIGHCIIAGHQAPVRLPEDRTEGWRRPGE